jgi:hypothetical protein
LVQQVCTKVCNRGTRQQTVNPRFGTYVTCIYRYIIIDLIKRARAQKNPLFHNTILQPPRPAPLRAQEGGRTQNQTRSTSNSGQGKNLLEVHTVVVPFKPIASFLLHHILSRNANPTLINLLTAHPLIPSNRQLPRTTRLPPLLTSCWLALLTTHLDAPLRVLTRLPCTKVVFIFRIPLLLLPRIGLGLLVGRSPKEENLGLSTQSEQVLCRLQFLRTERHKLALVLARPASRVRRVRGPRDGGTLAAG